MLVYQRVWQNHGKYREIMEIFKGNDGVDCHLIGT
jgi:hypothetical protein